MSAINVGSWNEAFLSALQTTLVQFLYYIPTLLAAFIIFLLGLLLAKWGRNLTVRLLKAISLSSLVQKSGLEKFLTKAEITIKIEEILGGLVRWLIILLFFITAINVLGLSTVSLVLDAILAYLPRVFAAVLILAIGVLLAGLVENLIKGALFNIDVKAARLLARIGSYLVVIFTAMTALNELGIAQTLITTLFVGVVAMLALGFGLAIGLGSKDLVSKIVEEWYQNFKKELKKKQ